MKRLTVGLVLSLLFAPVGCVRPPPIILVDRATALEQQAAGSFADLEEQLLRSAIAPRATPLTPEQLTRLGIKPAPLVDATEETDADRVDGLLKQRCLGESREGTLVDTHDSCRGASDRVVAVSLLHRVNRARQQLWRWMQSRRPGASIDELRRSWQSMHLRGVVCGAWIQRADGGWEAKKC